MLDFKFVRCPLCNGQGFVARWELGGTVPRLHKAECVRCGGTGNVVVSQAVKYIRKGGEDNG